MWDDLVSFGVFLAMMLFAVLILLCVLSLFTAEDENLIDPVLSYLRIIFGKHTTSLMNVLLGVVISLAVLTIVFVMSGEAVILFWFPPGWG